MTTASAPADMSACSRCMTANIQQRSCRLGAHRRIQLPPRLLPRSHCCRHRLRLPGLVDDPAGDSRPTEVKQYSHILHSALECPCEHYTAGIANTRLKSVASADQRASCRPEGVAAQGGSGKGDWLRTHLGMSDASWLALLLGRAMSAVLSAVLAVRCTWIFLQDPRELHFLVVWYKLDPDMVTFGVIWHARCPAEYPPWWLSCSRRLWRPLLQPAIWTCFQFKRLIAEYISQRQ